MKCQQTWHLQTSLHKDQRHLLKTHGKSSFSTAQNKYSVSDFQIFPKGFSLHCWHAVRKSHLRSKRKLEILTRCKGYRQTKDRSNLFANDREARSPMLEKKAQFCNSNKEKWCLKRIDIEKPRNKFLQQIVLRHILLAIFLQLFSALKFPQFTNLVENYPRSRQPVDSTRLQSAARINPKQSFVHDDSPKHFTRIRIWQKF